MRITILAAAIGVALWAFGLHAGKPAEASVVTAVSESERVAVAAVFDGDTLELEDGRVIQLIGVECPELSLSAGDMRKAAHLGVPRSFYAFYGRQARNYLEKQVKVKGQDIRMSTDPGHAMVDYRDYLGRRMVYLFAGGEMLNETLIQRGLCTRDATVQNRYLKRFRTGERRARQNRAGMWNRR